MAKIFHLAIKHDPFLGKHLKSIDSCKVSKKNLAKSPSENIILLQQ